MPVICDELESCVDFMELGIRGTEGPRVAPHNYANIALISVPTLSHLYSDQTCDSLEMRCWFCVSLNIFNFEIFDNTNKVAILKLSFRIVEWFFQTFPRLHHPMTYSFCVLLLTLIRYIIQVGKGHQPINPLTPPFITILLRYSVKAGVGWAPTSQDWNLWNLFISSRVICLTDERTDKGSIGQSDGRTADCHTIFCVGGCNYFNLGN